MGGILQGIPKVGVYFDDILVMGLTKEEHPNLEEVLRRMEDADLRL